MDVVNRETPSLLYVEAGTGPPQSFDLNGEYIAWTDSDHRPEGAGHDDVARLQRLTKARNDIRQPDGSVQRVAEAGGTGADRNLIATPFHQHAAANDIEVGQFDRT